jgi:cyanate permease
MFCFSFASMYESLIYLHSFLRWFVLLSLIIALYKAFRGYFSNTKFTKSDNAIRHWTATIAHIQLMVGMVLYFQSPLIKYFLKNGAKEGFEYLFFGTIHSTLMLVAIVIVTIGSAMAKRKKTDKEKFRTMMVWYSLGLIIIFIAIPWPFSPFSNRPYLR